MIKVLLGGKVMKKQLNRILIIAIMMIFALSAMSFGASSLSSYSVDEDDINKDDTFTMTLNFDDVSDYDYLVITSSDFENTKGLTRFELSNPLKIDLKYVGTDNSFTFDLYDDNGTESDTSDDTKTGSDTVHIQEVKEYSSSTDESSKTDTSKYMPVLSASKKYGIKTYTAGEKVTIKVPIANIGKYSAKDVKVTLDLSEKSPFINKDSAITTIDRISREHMEYAVFELNVSELATPMHYQIPVKIEGYNSHKDPIDSVNDYYELVIENNQTKPQVDIYNYEFLGELTSEEPVALIIDLKNYGSLLARNVEIDLSGFSQDGIRLSKDTNVKQITTIEGGDTERIYYKVIKSPIASDETVTLSSKVTFSDNENNTYEKENQIFIDMDGISNSDVQLDIENLSYQKNVVSGDDLVITFDLVNNSKVALEKTEVTLEYPQQMISKSPKKIFLEKLEAGEKVSGKYTLLIDDGLQADNYNFFIKTKTWPNELNDEKVFENEKYFGVYVEGSSSKGRPKLIVDDYEFGGENVLAGKEFPLKLYIRNTSDVQGVQNIKVNVSSTDGVFMPVNSSSSFFIDFINSNEVIEKEILLKTKSDAHVKNYSLDINMEYEDSDGNAYDSEGNLYKESDQLSIPVLQPVRLETSEVREMGPIFVGAQGSIEVEFYNMGKSVMNNMMVKVEGDFDVQNGNYFVGNFESGQSDYFSPMIIAKKEGPAKGKFIFSFEDSAGNVSNIEKDFEVFASPMPTPDIDAPDEGMSGGPIMPGKEEKSNKKIYIGLGIVAVILLLGFMIRRRKTRKERKLRELEALDD